MVCQELCGEDRPGLLRGHPGSYERWLQTGQAESLCDATVLPIWCHLCLVTYIGPSWTSESTQTHTHVKTGLVHTFSGETSLTLPWPRQTHFLCVLVSLLPGGFPLFLSSAFHHGHSYFGCWLGVENLRVSDPASPWTYGKLDLLFPAKPLKQTSRVLSSPSTPGQLWLRDVITTQLLLHCDGWELPFISCEFCCAFRGTFAVIYPRLLHFVVKKTPIP